MAVVNRYSREPQLSEFTPLTGAEVMAVPLLKQEMEDKKIADNRDLLKELYNTKAVQADQGKVNDVRSGLESDLKALSDEIATKGISRGRTDKFNKLKSNYDKEMSSAGTIGHANEFVALRDAAKANFYNSASAKTWSKDNQDNFWAAHSSQQSAFNQDGTFNTQYDELGLPNYTTADAELYKLVNTLGIKSVRDAQGKLIEGNVNQVDAAIRTLRAKFNDNTTPEGRVATLNKWNDPLVDANGNYTHGGKSKLDLQLEGAREAIISDKVHEPLPRVQKAVTDKKRKDFIETDNIYKIASDIQALNLPKNKAANIDKIKEYEGIIAAGGPDAEKAKESLLLLEETERKLKAQFMQADSSKRLANNLETVLYGPKGLNPEELLVYDSITNNGASNKEIDALLLKKGLIKESDLIKKIPYSPFNHGAKLPLLPIDVARNKYIADNLDPDKHPKVVAAKEAHDVYNDALYGYLGGTNGHLLMDEYVLGNPLEGAKSPQKAAIAAFKEDVVNLIHQKTGGVQFLEGSFTDSTGGTFKEVSKDDMKKLPNLISTAIKSEDIVSLLGGSIHNNPAARVSVTFPNNEGTYGSFKGRTVDIVLGFERKDPKDMVEKVFVDKLSALSGNGKQLGAANSNFYKFGDITPSSIERDTFYNDSKLKEKFTENGLMHQAKTGFKAIDIFYDSKEKGFLYLIDTPEGTRSLTYADALKGLPKDTYATEEVVKWANDNIKIIMPILDQIAMERGYREINIKDKQARSDYKLGRLIQLKESNKEYGSQDKNKLLNAL